ncbi:MAG: DUF433 domain-containing protein [Flavobacteriales bacterium]|nr:DUF433 domain-containing protein [Flavobacteriales bacterium]
MAHLNDLISVDPAVLSGCPVFAGTRVPVESLIWHLEKGATVDEFVEDFPSVHADQVKGVLDLLGGNGTSPHNGPGMNSGFNLNPKAHVG